MQNPPEHHVRNMVSLLFNIAGDNDGLEADEKLLDNTTSWCGAEINGQLKATRMRRKRQKTGPEAFIERGKQ